MSEAFISIVAPREFMERVHELAKVDSVEVGEPVPAEALNDALDAPLGPEELKQIFEVVTLVFQLGTAAFGFAKSLIELVRVTEVEEIKLVDDGRVLAAVTAQSTPEEVVAVLRENLE